MSSLWLFARLAAFHFLFFCTMCYFPCLLFNIIPNSENNSPDNTVFPLTEGSCTAKVLSSAWNCCTWAQTSCLNLNVLSLAQLFFFFSFSSQNSKLSECPCTLLRSVLLTASPAFWNFLVSELHQTPPTSRMSGLILVLKWGQKRWNCVRFELKDWFAFNRYIQYDVLVES